MTKRNISSILVTPFQPLHPTRDVGYLHVDAEEKTLTIYDDKGGSKEIGSTSGSFELPIASTTTLGGIKISSSDFSITVDGTLSTKDKPSCLPIPQEVSTENVTTLQLCNSLYNSKKDNAGMIYMGTVKLTDSPLKSYGQSDLKINIISKPKYPENPQDNDVDTVYLLQLNSTNTRQRSWNTMYFKSRWTPTQQDGSMQYGDSDCPWFAKLLAPIEGYNQSKRCGDPFDKKFRAATEKYVDDKLNQFNTVLKKATAGIMGLSSLLVTSGYLTAEEVAQKIEEYQNQ